MKCTSKLATNTSYWPASVSPLTWSCQLNYLLSIKSLVAAVLSKQPCRAAACLRRRFYTNQRSSHVEFYRIYSDFARPPPRVMPLQNEDPAHLSKSRLKSDLVAHNVAVPPANSKKDVYVELRCGHIGRQRAVDFSSDEEDHEHEEPVS